MDTQYQNWRPAGDPFRGGNWAIQYEDHIPDEHAFANYTDFDDFQTQNAWQPYPAGVRWKDGTDMFVNGGGPQSWDPEHHQYTVIICALATVLDPEQIVGISFYPAYEPNEQGSRVDKPNYYIPLE